MMRSCVLPATALRADPAPDARQTSELLFGEAFALLDLTGGWAWGYSLADHYVGYLAAEALGAPIAPTHRVTAAEAILHKIGAAVARLPDDFTTDHPAVAWRHRPRIARRCAWCR